jgi:hypothetical protein
VRIDPFKLTHWMNTRKYTVAQTAALAHMSEEALTVSLREHGREAEPDEVAALAAALRIDPSQLTADAKGELSVVLQSAEAMRGTKRPIQRDGIHFYNYYTLAAPPGRVAPVILDILCPAGRLPALNNGHLEPAITVNLGPGDINGRWGQELTPWTWRVLRANADPDRWITGDSYIEPSHCPHAYSLASDRPARIVSYTGQCNLASLVEEINIWPQRAFENCLEALGQQEPRGRMVDSLLARRAHTRASAAVAAGLDTAELTHALLEDPLSGAGLAVLRQFARAVGLDYRLLLPAESCYDEVGKTWATVQDARASVRRFAGHQSASMALAPHLPDLAGTFLCINEDELERPADLIDCAESHYVVVDGDVALEWEEASGYLAAKFTADGSAWVAPFIRHQWRGHGSVLKLSSGAHLGYLDWLELTNTFAPAATLRRSRRDLASWGYED